jgi:hypothetical protein
VNRAQTALALGMAAAIDRRTVGEADVAAWYATLGDLDYDDVQAAIAGHYQATREWLMPSDIRAWVAAVRRERVEKVIGIDPIPAPPRELDDDPAAGVRWQQACIEAIASGRRTTREQAETEADAALDVVRQVEAIRARPVEALTASLAEQLRAPGTREAE